MVNQLELSRSEHKLGETTDVTQSERSVYKDEPGTKPPKILERHELQITVYVNGLDPP